jgi:hypothetical protein
MCSSYPPLNIWKIGPDFDAAEVGAFGADGSGNSGAKITGRTDVSPEFRENLADLIYFFNR